MTVLVTSQNTMYCGGQPDNAHSLIALHKIHAHVMNGTFKPCSWFVYESQVLDTNRRSMFQ